MWPSPRRAADHVVDQVAHLAEHAGHPAVVADLALHHGQVAAGRERLARAGDHDRPGLLVARDVGPHPGELPVHGLVGGVVLLRPVHRDQEHAVLAPFEEQAIVAAVVHVGAAPSIAGESRRVSISRARPG
jgi:hypothetical protein